MKPAPYGGLDNVVSNVVNAVRLASRCRLKRNTKVDIQLKLCVVFFKLIFTSIPNFHA